MTSLDGALRILCYNWPTYVSAAATCAALAGARRRFSRTSCLRPLLTLGIGLTGYWSLASLVVSEYVYERSELTRWKSWLPALLDRTPHRILNLHVGVDEIGSDLYDLFPDSKSVSIDVFDPAMMRWGSIRRARALTTVESRHADWRALPFSDGSWDTVLVAFAAHEVRDLACRQALFRELRRVLAPDGQLVLVEHVRAIANFLAFGPGVLHFLPLAAWHRVAAEVGLRVAHERKVTPFVTALVLERSTA